EDGIRSFHVTGVQTCGLRILLLRTLADHALRYGGDGVRVLVTLAREAGGVVLRVEDSGAGLGDEQRSHLGERFFRVLGTAAPGKIGRATCRDGVESEGGAVAW